MQNGYFQLVNAPGGFGIRLIPPKNGGEDIQINELVHYLESLGIIYELDSIKNVVDSKKDEVCFLIPSECPAVNESYDVNISSDSMTAFIRFFPPSETGKRITFNDVLEDLRFRNIFSGIQMQVLQDHFMSSGSYCTNLLVAKGREPIHGEDDRIEYYFNTDVHAQPEEREDGTVDYHNLNIINHCSQGMMLAKIIRGKTGEAGIDVKGKRIAPRDAKKAKLKYGKNIQLSEDKLSIASLVDGHVMLVDDSVFVSDVFEVENVDTSTGNIDYTGSVQVNGNVASNFTVQAGGNVVINGVVEGARITAGGDIIIARGMNGMSKGILKAKGNIIAKFIENATVEADGYVNVGAILHSNVNAGTEITVNGKKGFITGGHVRASNQVTAKTIGAVMGAPTVVEVGIAPKLKAEYMQLQKDIIELVKSIKAAQPVLADFSAKRAKGVQFSMEQIKYVSEAAKKMESQKAELGQKNTRIMALCKQFDPKTRARVVVNGEVYAGTTIIIGELSMVIQNKYHYCKFEVVEGDVKSVPM